MTWTPTTALRAGASVAVLASGALLLAACSSGSSGTPAAGGAKPSSSVSAGASASGSMTAYRDCLSQHGVELPSFAPRTGRPSGQPSGRPSGGGGFGGFGGGFGGASADPTTQAAMKACESLRPRFSGRGGAGGADSSAFQAFRSCLKDHGVTLSTAPPSPGSTARPRGGVFGGLDTSDPKTAAAYNTCKALLPQRPSPAAS